MIPSAGDPAGSAIQPLPCACASVRRAARAITQHYDDAFRPLGLRATQFTLLAALAAVGSASQRRLGEALAFDATTLTRTLRVLKNRGWILSAAGRDRRERHWRLSAVGRRHLDAARPHWKKAQDRLRQAMGDAEWQALQASLLRVTRSAKGAA